MMLPDRFPEFTLRYELDPRIEGQPNLLASLRLARNLGVKSPLLDIAHQPQLAVQPLEFFIQALFDAAIPLLGKIYAANHVRRQRLVGVEPLAFSAKLDPF